VPQQLRAKDILAAKKEEAREYGKNQRRAATVGCAGLSASGVGLLGYHHFEFLQPYLLDITGLGLLGAAAVIGKEVFGKKSTPAAKRGGWQLKLVPLHDEARYATAIAALHGTAGKDKDTASAGPLDEALAAAEKVQAEKAEEAKAERSAELLKEVAEELAAGAAPRRVRQRLAPRVFVIDFDTRPPARGGGDAQPPKAPPNMRAMLETLREQVGLLLHVASPYDEVVLRVTSPGGSVMDYGLAAALFGRLKAAGVRTTACVDLVAASGGYMLACTAHTIVAAPFAMVGSIGVIAGAPNVSKLLERGGVDYVQRTGGAHKRTINVFTPNTEEGLQKFEEEIGEIHRSFAAHVSAHRPQLAAAAGEAGGEGAGGASSTPGTVFTGETWLAEQAPQGLVDVLSTSDQYLRGRQLEAEVFLLEPAPAKKSPFDLGLLRLLTEAALEARAAAARLAGWGAALRGGDGGAAGGYASDASAAAAAVSQLHAETPWSRWSTKPLLRAPEGGALGSDANRFV